ncbi:MAG: CvpA family protein [Fidelibacterota bacterium]
MILFLDILTMMFIVAMGAIGFKRGLVEELGRLIGLIVASSFAWSYYIKLSDVVLNAININPWVVMILDYFIIFSVVLLIVRILTKFTHLLLLAKSTKLLNRGMGFIFGIFKAALLVTIFLWIVDIAPLDNWSNIIHEQSKIASSLRSTRQKLINIFNIQDPIQKSEQYIQELMENEDE